MKRLTSDNVFEMSMTEVALNQVFVRDGWARYRKSPEDECSVCDLIRGAAAKGLWQENIELDPNLTDEEVGDVMLDWLQFGEEEPEGVLAILYRALWAMAELRERLKLYEDILFAADGTELITLGRLQEVRARLKNDPLTLDELREMEGEPVWVDGDSETELGKSGWAILWHSNVEKYLSVWWPGEEYADVPALASYGDTWTAYRHKSDNPTNAE